MRVWTREQACWRNRSLQTLSPARCGGYWTKPNQCPCPGAHTRRTFGRSPAPYSDPCLYCAPTSKRYKDARTWACTCLLYTSDAADDLLCVDLGGRRIIKKKK